MVLSLHFFLQPKITEYICNVTTLLGGIGVTPMISTFHELASRMGDKSLVMTS
jgi:ferredoxin-NADP reductase